MKNLIRNGGFERNTTDFWTAYDEKSFTAVATPVHKGSYAGKLVCDGSNQPYVIPNDYYPVSMNEAYSLTAWFRRSGALQNKIYALYYTEGLDLLAEIQIKSFNPPTTSFGREVCFVSSYPDAAYVQIKIKSETTTLDEYLLIDTVSLVKWDPLKAIALEVTMIEETNINSTGSVNSDPLVVAGFREAVFMLYTSTCSGTAETLDVVVQSYDLESALWSDIATFTQVTSSGGVQNLVISEGLGNLIRVRRTVGGTPTDIDYMVTGKFKR